MSAYDEKTGKYNGSAGGRGGFRLDEAMLEKIVGLMRMGNYIVTACQACGITDVTYRKWGSRGRECIEALVEAEGEESLAGMTYLTTEMPDSLRRRGIHNNEWMCARFVMGTFAAQAEAEAFAVGKIQGAIADGDWRAAMTFLERKAPQRWRKRDSLEVSQMESKDKRDEDHILTPEAQELMHRALTAAAKKPPLEDAIDSTEVDDDADVVDP